MKPACRAGVVEEEGSGVTAVPKGQNGLPALREARRVYGRLCCRDARVLRSTAAIPTEHVARLGALDVPAQRSNRVGDGALVERWQRDLHVRFDENVWRERERAVQALSQEQANHRLLRITAGEGLDFTKR